MKFNGNRFLPEPVHFEAMTDEERVRAARLTARFLGAWATRYRAWPVSDQVPVRPGLLPRARRAAVIDEVFAWVGEVLVARGLPPQWVGLGLYYRNRLVLDQHDGIPAHLFLTEEQFAQLQEYWRDIGLPEDLYFAAKDRHVVSEPQTMFGGVYLGPGRYSPLQWARRASTPRAPTAVPGEAERELALIAAGVRFVGALALRRLELMETGREPDTNELAKVDALSRLVSSLLSDIVKRRNLRGVGQGQPSTDTDEQSQSSATR